MLQSIEPDNEQLITTVTHQTILFITVNLEQPTLCYDINIKGLLNLSLLLAVQYNL